MSTFAVQVLTSSGRRQSAYVNAFEIGMLCDTKADEPSDNFRHSSFCGVHTQLRGVTELLMASQIAVTERQDGVKSREVFPLLAR